jgi:hypothetical protein
MTHRNVIRISALLLAAVVLGCSNDDPTGIDQATLLEVSPLFAGLDIGAQQPVIATVGGTPVSATWESSNPSIATVDANTGVVTALAPGFTAVTGTLTSDGRLITSNITVVPLLASTLLVSGVPVTINDAVATRHNKLYRIAVPTGATKLVITTTGLNPAQDVDLFASKSVAPTSSTRNSATSCFAAGPDTNETCTVNNPASGTWYILTDIFTPLTDVILTATVTL